MHAEGIHSLDIVQLFMSLVSCVRGEFTQVQPEDPGETTQGNRRLGGLEEGICCVYSVYEQH